MYLYKSHRPTWAEIDLDAIKNNYKAIRSKLVGDNQIMAVVKADAYGHGAVNVSQELLKMGVQYLAVSNIDEAIELRSSGISSPVLVLGPVESAEFSKLIEFNIYPTVSSMDYARELSEAYRYRGIYPKVHIEVDSGMGRLGIPVDEALSQVEQITKMEGIIIDGIFSHFPSADKDPDFSKHQVRKFNRIINEMKKLDFKIKNFHFANSAGIFNVPESVKAPYNMCRPGLALYGYTTTDCDELQNSMSVKTRVVAINVMRKGDTVSYLQTYEVKKDREQIAVLPIGYADGIPTSVSNKAKVLIGKSYYPVVGRVCMDYMMVSLGDNKAGVKINDEVTVMGTGKISVEHFAKMCGKIPYEVTCDVSKRVPRLYIRKEDKR